MGECPYSQMRVFIADAYPIIRNGLITTVEAEAQMRVVGIATHHNDLVAQLRSIPVDVLVITLDGMGQAPVTLMGELRHAFPALGIVVVASAVDFAPELLAAGVQSYISYAEPNEQLHLAIRAAKAKQRFVSPLVQDYMDRCTRIRAHHRFAPRELQIIKYMAQGLDTNEIARQLNLSFMTVRNYVWSIRKKTGWTTWPQMVSWYHTLYGSGITSNIPQRHTGNDLERSVGCTGY